MRGYSSFNVSAYLHLTSHRARRRVVEIGFVLIPRNIPERTDIVALSFVLREFRFGVRALKNRISFSSQKKRADTQIVYAKETFIATRKKTLCAMYRKYTLPNLFLASIKFKRTVKP